MRFTLLDKILQLEPGVKLVGLKNLSMAEEYLADHFPGFPVMPGVMMLEAMTQAAAWLIRATDDFAHSSVLLKEARHVKYASFVEPGQALTVNVTMVEHGPRLSQLKAQGTVDGSIAVAARLVIERSNLADTNPSRAIADDVVKAKMRELFALLYSPVSGAAASA